MPKENIGQKSMRLIRASLFHFVFTLYHVVACVVCLPFLLTTRARIRALVQMHLRIVAFLERMIMGLDYEVRGREYLPDQGAFLVAAKHQSAYETFKLHFLFDDPAIVLKQELLRIPLWGRFLSALSPIAIDRTQGRSAIEQIIAGANQAKDQGRAIVIFPQGTRVSITQSPAEKPYKIGIVRMQEATNLPIIPMALNSGYFWPRRGWGLRSGKVIFEFLPPLTLGTTPQETLQKLEHVLEDASLRLVAEASGHFNDRDNFNNSNNAP